MKIEPIGLKRDFRFRGEGQGTAGEKAAKLIQEIMQASAKIEANLTFFGDGDRDYAGEGGDERFGDKNGGHGATRRKLIQIDGMGVETVEESGHRESF